MKIAQTTIEQRGERQRRGMPSQHLRSLGKDGYNYAMSVLAPFESDVVRGPSDFYQPTSILSWQFETDVTFGAVSSGAVVLYPHNTQTQYSQNAPVWFNVMPGTSQPPTVVGGSGIVPYDSILKGQGSIQLSEVNGRYLSYRVVRCGIRIYAQDNITIKQGILTIGSIPGKEGIPNASTLSLPTVAQVRQYPTSFEIPIASIGDEGVTYVWLPLDPADMIFLQAYNGNDITSTDNLLLTSQFRSPIVALFSNLQNNAKFRVQINIGYEFVPTPGFEAWAPVARSPINSDVTRELNTELGTNIFEAVTGDLGKTLIKLAPHGQRIGSALNMIL